MDKSALMEQLRSTARVIQQEYCDPDTKLVWGEGNLDSSLVVVAEAPGASEDVIGRPFVGAAGELLNRELLRAGFTRESIYITNVVKCRPTRGDDGKKSNRPPTTKEVRAWLDTLINELSVISPSIILCLGAVSSSALIHPGFSMNAERGQWFSGPLNTRAIATFHPAYLLRSRQYGEGPLRLFRADLDAVANELHMLTRKV